MNASETTLEARAVRAYEIGRVDAALRRAVLLLPLPGVAFLCCADPARSIGAGIALVAAVAFCLWRGGAFGRGVGPGLLAGAVPLLVPLAMQATGRTCEAGRCSMAPTACILAGVAGGVVLGLLAPRPLEARGLPFVTASLIAGLAGSVGCWMYGLVGLAGMVAGLAAGAAPALVVRRARG